MSLLLGEANLVEPIGDVVLLTPSAERVRFFRRLGHANGFPVRWVQRLDEAAALISGTGSRILVCDSNGPGYNWTDALRLTRGALHGASLVVVLSSLDSSRWLEVLRAGAGDVVCEPLNAESALAALEGAMRASRVLEEETAARPHGRGRLNRLWAALGRALRKMDHAELPRKRA